MFSFFLFIYKINKKDLQHKEYKKVKGDINAVRGINQYCTEPDAYWDRDKVRDIQTKLLLDLWDGRDALTGRKFLRDENGNLLEKVDRHHYEVLDIDGRTVIFIKYDCRLVAQVLLSGYSHGTIRDAGEARNYANNFKRVMERLMRGEWATPDWWDDPDDIRHFEENLLRLGYVKPDNLDR